MKFIENRTDAFGKYDIFCPGNFPPSPRISVVMSVYNGAEHLAQALKSILNQTCGDFECIVINDRSTDNSRDIILSSADPRLCLIDNHENIGLTRSLNRGIALARGTYIARMDADDISMPTRFEKQLAFLDTHPDYALVGTQYRYLQEPARRLLSPERPQTDAAIREHLRRDNCIGHGTVMIRRAALEDIGLYDPNLSRSQDYDLFLRLSRKYKLANLPDFLYIWRDHPRNITSQNAREQFHCVERIKWKNLCPVEKQPPHPDISPDFSVLMANYNNAAYIAEAVESVLHQTHTNWELLIFDDVSTDDSLSVIEPFLRDPRIRLVRNEKNIGYTATLKRLVYESLAPVVGILDSDDTLAPDALECVLSAYKTHPECGFVYTQLMWCDENLHPLHPGISATVPPGNTALRLDCVSAFRTFRKAVYYRTPGFNESILYAEDKDLIYKMEEVAGLHFIDNVLYHYRRRTGSQTTDRRKWLRGVLSHYYAKYTAWRRRLGTPTPNLTRPEIFLKLLYVAAACIRFARPVWAARFTLYALSVFIPADRLFYHLKECLRIRLLQFKSTKLYSRCLRKYITPPADFDTDTSA